MFYASNKVITILYVLQEYNTVVSIVLLITIIAQNLISIINL